MKLYSNVVVICFLSLICSLNVFSQTRYVATAGSDAGPNNCTAPGSPCLTIQHAIDQANPGDVISIEDGVYQETASINVNTNVVIQGESESNTIVELNDVATTLFLVNFAGVTFQDITLRVDNAHSNYANTNLLNPHDDFVARNITIQNAGFDGVRCVSQSNLLFETCTFIDNRNSFRSVSTAVVDGLTFRDCIFTGRLLSQSVGIYVANEGGGGYVNNLLVEGCTFSDHQPAQHPGIGIYAEDLQNAIISNNHFENNHRSILLFKGFSPERPMSNVQIDSNTFISNNIGLQLANAPGTSFSGITSQFNNFYSNTDGYLVSGGGTGWATVAFNNNCIDDNVNGMRVASSVEEDLDATENFWGHPSGPTHMDNPGGVGDLINVVAAMPGVEVDFSGFLASCGPVIPTLSQWGLLILGLMFSIMAVMGIRRRNSKPDIAC